MALAKKLPPVESGLSPDDVREHYDEFSKILLERQAEIVGRVNAARANIDEQVMTAPGDVGDISVIDMGADYFIKLADQQRRELLQIRDALDRIDRGVYGICEACENPISVARLRKHPLARRCISCQTAAESNARIR